MPNTCKTSSASHTLIAPGIFLLLLVLLTLVLFQQLRQWDEHQARTSQFYFREVITRAAATTRANLLATLHPVQETAAMLAKQWPLTDDEVREIFQTHHILGKFKQVGLYLPDGRVIGNGNGQNLRISKRELALFDTAGTGRGTISTTTVDSEDGLAVNTFLAPVRQQEKIVGVIFATLDSTLLSPLMDLPLFDKKGGSFVMDSQGKGVSLSFAHSLHNNDFFESMTKTTKFHTPEEELRATLAKGLAGTASFRHRDCEFYVAFAPVGINDWFSIGFIPATLATGEVQATKSSLLWTLLCVGLACVSMLGYILWQVYSQRQMRQRHNFRMETLGHCFPGSILRCRDDATRTLLEYNQGFLDMLGFTMDEIKNQFYNQLLPLIYAPDRAAIMEKVSSTHSEGNSACRLPLEYRLERKDGSQIWVNEYSHLAHENNDTHWCIVLLDVSSRRNALERRMVEEKRYRILFEMSEAILYEYDMRTGVLATTRQFFDKFGYPMSDTLNSLHPVDIALLHPEDVGTFVSLHQALLDGEASAEALVRIKRHDGEWLWCHVQQTALLNSDQICIRALGRITDVDAETRVLYQLRDEMQRDPFTGLYNKVATAALVDEALCQLEEGQTDWMAALCIVDIDNFKHVNDRLGHAKGDKVLKNLSESLASIFRKSDIVGRVGGDEFIVFVRDVRKLKSLMQKMEIVLQSMHRTIACGDGEEFYLSASIGVALSPQDGVRYTHLYPRADKALYRSKATKNACNYYDAVLDGE